jgi:glycosyltransferase involved in cell wall biosynthesis
MPVTSPAPPDDRHGISVCLLVRDESWLLRRHLPVLRSAADEVIVVDNGSSDDSASVAAGAGARVISAPDVAFDAARDRYVEAATRAWILVIDADEVMDPDVLRRLKRDLRTAPDEVAAYSIPSYQYLGAGRWSLINLLRLFRNEPGMRYSSNGLHDTIRFAAQRLGTLGDRYAPIHHMDALIPHRAPAKRSRNVGMLRDLLRTARFGPDNPESRIHLMLGQEYLALTDYPAAETELRLAASFGDDREHFAELLLCQLMVRLGRYGEALAQSRTLAGGTKGPNVQRPTVVAQALLGLHRTAEATAVCVAAAEEYPEVAHHHLNLAALTYRDDPVAALARLRIAASLNPAVFDRRIYGRGDDPALFRPQPTFLSVTPDFVELVYRVVRATGDRAAADAWRASVAEAFSAGPATDFPDRTAVRRAFERTTT